MPIRQGCNTNLIQFTFSIKDVFSLFIFEVDFTLKIEDTVCLLFLELQLNTKQGPAKERTHLFTFIQYVKKNYWKKNNKKKKQWTCRWEKMSKAVEQNKLTVLIKWLLWEFNVYRKFMCTDELQNELTPPQLHFSLFLKNYWAYDSEIFRLSVCFYQLFIGRKKHL